MAKKMRKFGLAALGTMHEGKHGYAFTAALEKIARDIDERANLKEKRKLTLEISFEPIANGQSVDVVNMVVQIKTAIPAGKCPIYGMKMHGDSAFVYDDDSLDNPDQHTIAEVIAEKAEKKK